MHRRILLPLAFCIAAIFAAPARGAAPAIEVISIDDSFNPPILSAVCGFPVTRQVQGTLTIRTFFDLNGAFTKELDQVHLTESVTANGLTLVGRTVQNIEVTLLDDGSFTVAFAGSDFRLPVPGTGIAFGSVGRLLLLFDADNNLIDVVQHVGDSRADYAAICEARSPA